MTLQKIQSLFCSSLTTPLNAQIKELQGKLVEEQVKNDILTKETETAHRLSTRREEELNKQIAKLQQPIDPLEKYWNERRPVTNWRYKARDKTLVDPRIFFQYDNTLPSYSNLKTNDEKAINCLAWVNKNIKYTLKDEKDGEYWKFAYETLRDKRGDCDDGAILIACMMLSSGVPYWRIRINAGSVKGGNHCYVTYLKESDNEWYVLDWCYWFAPLGVKWKLAEKYYSDSDGKEGFGIWGSCNQKFSFGDLPKGDTNAIQEINQRTKSSLLSDTKDMRRPRLLRNVKVSNTRNSSIDDDEDE